MNGIKKRSSYLTIELTVFIINLYVVIKMVYV